MTTTMGQARRWAAALGAVVAGAGPAVLALAGAAKLASWDSASRGVESLTLLSPPMRTLALVMGPAAEFVPLALLASARVAAAQWWTLGFLLAATAVYLAQWALAEPPTCACFGAWSAYVGLGETVGGIVLRNFLLAGFPAATLLALRAGRRPWGTA